jgi:hypothetical protein
MEGWSAREDQMRAPLLHLTDQRGSSGGGVRGRTGVSRSWITTRGTPARDRANTAPEAKDQSGTEGKSGTPSAWHPRPPPPVLEPPSRGLKDRNTGQARHPILARGPDQAGENLPSLELLSLGSSSKSLSRRSPGKL